jgi:MFS family permease
VFVECLAGPCFALGWTAGVKFSRCSLYLLYWYKSTNTEADGAARELAPAGEGATMMGVYTGLKFGVGVGVGSFAGGALTSVVGLRGMFFCMGCLALAVAALMRLYLVFARK